jgi:hypothetical protein
MTSDDFIAELDRRRLLSDRLMAKLRDLLAGYDQPYTGEELADFLILKNHLTREQANAILESGAPGGVNLFQANAADLDDDDPFGGSSIFGSRAAAATNKQPEPRGGDEGDDEFQLAPLDDAADSPKSDVLAEEDLPVLSVVPSKEGALSGWTSQTPSSILSNPETEDVVVPDKPVEQRPLTEELVTPTGPTARRSTSLSRGKKKKGKDNSKENGDKKSKRTRRAKTWDSPLILYGGGGLTLLVLIGVTVWLLLSRQTGNDVLAQADAALKAGAYPQAIEQYENFLKDFPNHPEHSNGRVRLAMTRIRQPTEGGDYSTSTTKHLTYQKKVEE